MKHLAQEKQIKNIDNQHTYENPVSIRKGLSIVHWGIFDNSSREFMFSNIPYLGICYQEFNFQILILEKPQHHWGHTYRNW